MFAPDWPELRESIRSNGLNLPVYFFEGQILDGAKRYQIAMEVAAEMRTEEIHTMERAASLLWGLHPMRALERFAGVTQERPQGTMPLREQCLLFGAKPSEIIAVRPKRPKPPKRQSRELTQNHRIRLPTEAAKHLRQMSEDNRCTASAVVTALLQTSNESKVREVVRHSRLTDKRVK